MRASRAAYARVAESVGVSVEELKASLSGQAPMTRAALLAHGMLGMSEKDLESRFRKNLADMNLIHKPVNGRPRFHAYHTYMSVHSERGFPDWVMIDRLKRTLYLFEFKTEHNDTTGSQDEWLDDLGLVEGEKVQVLGVIRPSNYKIVQAKFDYELPT